MDTPCVNDAIVKHICCNINSPEAHLGGAGTEPNFATLGAINLPNPPNAAALTLYPPIIKIFPDSLA